MLTHLIGDHGESADDLMDALQAARANHGDIPLQTIWERHHDSMHNNPDHDPGHTHDNEEN